MIKRSDSLPLHALQGFINSIFKLMNVPLTCRITPVSTNELRLSRWNIVTHQEGPSTYFYRFRWPESIRDGKWKVRKHGYEKHRTWRKLHLSVDVRTHEIISTEISLVNLGDSEVLPTLLNPLRRKIRDTSGDVAYYTNECHKILQCKEIISLIPPRK